MPDNQQHPWAIRPVTESDLPVCLEVIHRSFATVAVEFGLTEANCPTNGAFMPLERLQNDFRQGNLMFAAMEGPRIVGFAQLVSKPDDDYELAKLAVLPECRHQGLGRRLLGHARDMARARSGRNLTIGIIEENTRLKDWYVRQGFIPTGTRVFPHLPFTVGFMTLSVGSRGK